MNKTLEKIEALILSDVNELGFDIEYIEYVKELNSYVLKIVIEKQDKSNMTTEDCENVSRKIDEKVDNLMKGEYILEVSSPGFERVLKTDKLYTKYIGEEVAIKLFKKTNILKDIDLKEFTAKLTAFNKEDKKVTFKKDFDGVDVTFTLNKEEIASAHTVYDYDKMFKESKEKK